ncbi:ParB/RepB/Spo0J family partition protein [Desulfovibrio litoralis]|uniref:Chromosome segregation DNA-binding protein n=1 Tax=Desulfovibrio litoralis DSM 11393 TaxID=1121455 RepID=A0A1M7TKY0_9BACT|nr:ParB/RepB/Spo0J family partition protein [Desulfovibrio litoralis]SHN71387.1 chromosome segregation DNA-binding protein [Desulfovibrio litoralis DSM 11393]
MSNQSKGLGRGLEALFKANNEQSNQVNEVVKIIPIKQVKANQGQPRKTYDDAALQDLANSIKAQGILQPILVRPIHGTNPEEFEIVAGERRWRSAQIAGLTEVPVLVKMFGDMETLAVALIENLQRENLNPLEEALALRELKNEFNISQDELAEKIGKSRPYIANALRLLQLPEEIQSFMLSGELSAGHARALLAITDPAIQLEACQRILSEKLSVREAEKLATYWKEFGTLPESNLIRQTQASSTLKKTPPSIQLQDLTRKISGALDLKVKLSGSMEKGKLSVTFNNEAELNRLLSVLGLEG